MPDSENEITVRSLSPREQLEKLIEALCEEPFEQEMPDEEGVEMLNWHSMLWQDAQKYVRDANLSEPDPAPDVEERQEHEPPSPHKT